MNKDGACGYGAVTLLGIFIIFFLVIGGLKKNTLTVIWSTHRFDLPSQGLGICALLRIIENIERRSRWRYISGENIISSTTNVLLYNSANDCFGHDILLYHGRIRRNNGRKTGERRGEQWRDKKGDWKVRDYNEERALVSRTIAKALKL